METPANARADLSIQQRKKSAEKIKLDNKLTDTDYHRVLQEVEILRQGLSKAIASGTRGGSHKMLY